MQAAWLIQKHPKPTDAQIDAAMHENICRCGTYQRIRCAIKRAAEEPCGEPKVQSADKYEQPVNAEA
jgi:aerobic-type carbon monoxide dehydrogenase small subunit (CoxS/CutS family)